jgi:hypothetical protein
LRAILLTMLLFSATLGAAERRVLFAVVGSEGGAVIEPVAMLDPIAAPPRDAFPGRYFDPARRYHVFANAMPAGSVQPGARKEIACVSTAAAAKLEGRTLQESEIVLATNFAVPVRTTRDRELTVAESRALQRYARLFLRNRGVAAAAVATLETNARVMDVGGELLVVGSVSPPEASCAGSLFLIAKVAAVGATKVVPLVARFRPCGDCQDRAFIEPLDHLDLDGDGFDEVIGRDWGKEGYAYVIWRRDSGGRWSVVWGGGSGC